MGSFKTYDKETGEFSEYPYVTVKKTDNVKIVVSTGLYKNLKPIEIAHSGYVNISTVLHIPFFIFMRHLSLPRFSL